MCVCNVLHNTTLLSVVEQIYTVYIYSLSSESHDGCLVKDQIMFGLHLLNSHLFWVLDSYSNHFNSLQCALITPSHTHTHRHTHPHTHTHTHVKGDMCIDVPIATITLNRLDQDESKTCPRIALTAKTDQCTWRLCLRGLDLRVPVQKRWLWKMSIVKCGMPHKIILF